VDLKGQESPKDIKVRCKNKRLIQSPLKKLTNTQITKQTNLQTANQHSSHPKTTNTQITKQTNLQTANQHSSHPKSSNNLPVSKLRVDDGFKEDSMDINERYT
jgi:hypothetical protein